MALPIVAAKAENVTLIIYKNYNQILYIISITFYDVIFMQNIAEFILIILIIKIEKKIFFHHRYITSLLW